ncbi:hypothetical protein OJ998_27865 [Solirubrobacter taibaiensis]|nr:hypothetical protein [Solirubrobacter taibaiensis]
MFLLEPIVAAALALTPGWTQERLVSALGDAGGSFAVSHTDGEGLVAATTLNECAVTFAGLRPSAPPPVRELRETLVAGPRLSGDRYVAVLDRRGCGGKTIDLVDLDATGKVLRRKPLPVRGRAPSFTVLESGALMWTERRRLRLLVRGATEPVTVVRGNVEDVTTATGEDGSVFVAWTRGRRVRATTISRSGRVGAAASLGRSLGAAALKVVRQGRRTIVAWNTWDGMGETRARLYAAVRDGRRFRPAQLVDRAPQVDSGYEGFTPSLAPSLAIGPDGRALVGWHRFHDFNYEARLAAARPGHSFGRPRDIDAQELGDVGFDREGHAFVAWTDTRRVFVEIDGVREEVARPRFPYALSVSVLDDGRLQATWFKGWDEEEALPEVFIATRDW